MNEKLLLVWVVGKIILDLLKKPEKAEALKQKLLEAGDEEAVKKAITETGTEILAESVNAGLPPEIVEGLILATTEGGLDEILDTPQVKKGIFDVIGEVIGGIGKVIFGKKV